MGEKGGFDVKLRGKGYNVIESGSFEGDDGKEQDFGGGFRENVVRCREKWDF